MTLQDAANETAPESREFALVVVRGEEVFYAFEGDAAKLRALLPKLAEHIDQALKG